MPIQELINGDSIYDFDVTKAFCEYPGCGTGGHEVYDLLHGMNTISRSNLEIWEIFWLIFPSETGHGRSSVWSALFLRFGGASAGKRAA